MAGIPRKLAKIFGSALTATNNLAKFGSLKAGSPAFSTDLDQLQTTEWLSAWNGAVNTVGARPNVPAKQDANTLGFVLSTQIAYLLTRGIPEYDAGTTYNLNDVCRVAGIVYESRIDANAGHAPGASPTQWASINLAVGASNSGQTVLVDGNGHTIEFDTETFDTDAAFDPATFTFTAPVAGIYDVSALVQVDNGTAAAATLELAIRIVKNAGVAIANGAAVANPPGSRWYPSVSGLVQLAAGDTLKIQISGNDTVNTGNITLSNGNLSIVRVRAA